LSERGRMPMANQDHSVWITYNGESYNAGELRRMLMQRGYRFRSATDTEVVLHLYEEFGERCVERLRGMFAFAIWDARTRKLILARDRLGIKPLYYAISHGRLLFASEVKALLASGLLPISGTASAQPRTPRSSCTSTRNSGNAASSGCVACLRLPSGMRALGNWYWRATGWGSSRSTTPFRMAGCCSPQR